MDATSTAAIMTAAIIEISTILLIILSAAVGLVMLLVGLNYGFRWLEWHLRTRDL